MGDNWSGLAYGLALRNFRCIAFEINGHEKPSEMQQRAIADQIASTELSVTIVDSGLGYVNGIEIVRRLREVGMRTILLTGAPRTPETEHAADLYLRKPAIPSELAKIIGGMLGISRDDL